MKTDDRAAIIVLIILLMLIQRKDGGFRFTFDTGFTNEDMKEGAQRVAIGVVVYTALRIAAKSAVRFGKFVPGPAGALIAAASVALFVYPWLHSKISKTVGGAGAGSLPCGISEVSVCGGAGVEMWGINTMDGDRILSVVCKNGEIKSSRLLESCQ